MDGMTLKKRLQVGVSALFCVALAAGAADAAPHKRAPRHKPVIHIDWAQKAREAFYAGDARNALKFAPKGNERWIGGLAAYRMKAYGQAKAFFADVAKDDKTDEWLRSAAAFWAGRAASALGDAAQAADYIQLAANHPDTFYGKIAARQTRSADPIAALISGPQQVKFTSAPLQAPMLEPKAGFTLDKALVYAIVRQESRFNPAAVSSAGAVGLMQLMPEAAARAAGDDKLKADMSPLFDPAFNLRVGQDYVTWLMERGVGFDLLRTVAAYNGGPGALTKTAQMLGDDADDPLMLIESLPAQETRNYVEKVMANYWGYKEQWGEDAHTLDAVAAGARFIDARLDLKPDPNTLPAVAQTTQAVLQ
jgi:soluble lytic murein transglycosylase-like protein